jgi:hypothetical protein
MLLSSPDIPSPAHSQIPTTMTISDKYRNRISPEKKSALNQSFTPNDVQVEVAVDSQPVVEVKKENEAPPSYDYDIEELWSKLQSQYDHQHQHQHQYEGGMQSSGQLAEGLVGSGSGSGHEQGQGQDDFLALFNSLTNAQ